MSASLHLRAAWLQARRRRRMPWVPMNAVPRRLPSVSRTLTDHARELRVGALKQDISTLEENVRLLSAQIEEAEAGGRR